MRWVRTVFRKCASVSRFSERKGASAGREFYPLLVVMLAFILGLEHTMANRFYRQQER